jgi:uncharacterized Ntn-hydrolase superfamily protein
MEMSEIICTYTLLAREPETGSVGIVTASSCLCVGAVVPFMRSGIGAVAVQNLNDPRVAYAVMESLENGVDPKDAFERALKFFGHPEERQVAIRSIAPQEGHSVHFAATGTACLPWCGQIEREDLVILGNGLNGSEVLNAMEQGYRESRSKYFAERMIESLLAAERAGGDRRGKQSAAIKIVGTQSLLPPLLDLRVDDHPEASEELHHLWMLFHRATATHDSQRLTPPEELEPPSNGEAEHPRRVKS